MLYIRPSVRPARQRRLRRLLRDVQNDLLLESSFKPDRRDRYPHKRLFDDPHAGEDLTDDNVLSAGDAAKRDKAAHAAAREDF